MEQGDSQQMLPMPLLSRLDRLDRLVHYLEEKQSLSQWYCVNGIPKPQMELVEQEKPLASVLEEVPFKGTLVERVAMLENRVLQFSLDLEEASRLNSPVTPTGEHIHSISKNRNDFSVPSLKQAKEMAVEQNEEKFRAPANNQDKETVPAKPDIEGKKFVEQQAYAPLDQKKSRRTSAIMRYRKWLGWIQLRC